MTTIKLAVVPAKVLKNGKHKIRIAIGHKRVTKYLVTRFVVDSPDNLQDGQVVNVPDASRINVKLRNLLNAYEDALDRINANSYTCAQLVDYLSNIRQGSTTFADAADSYIADLIKEGRRSTADLYRRTCNYFADFTGRNLMLEGITPRTVKDFDLHLRDRGLNPVTRGTHLVHIKAVINRAWKSHATLTLLAKQDCPLWLQYD